MLSNYQIQDDKKYLEPRAGGMHIIGYEWKYSWWPEELEIVIDLYNRVTDYRSSPGALSQYHEMYFCCYWTWQSRAGLSRGRGIFGGHCSG